MHLHMRAAALAALVLACLPAASALAHGGNPNYLSKVEAVEPRVPGLRVEVLNRDDRLALTNRTGETVVIEGYNGEPHARVLGDGTVQVNDRSPATYLNEDRFARVDIPPQADEDAAPEWRTLDESGRFEWHDHRMHWMGDGVPPQVDDKQQRTKIFDYRIPLRVGNRNGDVAGTLFWVGAPSADVPIAAFIGLGIFAIAAGVLAIFVRRRRRLATNGEARRAAPTEAW